MLVRFFTYKAIKNHFFMLDFCYFVQVSAVLQSLMCWVSSDSGFCSSWFKANFVLSHGPLAIAILAWQNSIVFHSLDKMTSFYIHIMPALRCDPWLPPCRRIISEFHRGSDHTYDALLCL